MGMIIGGSIPISFSPQMIISPGDALTKLLMAVHIRNIIFAGTESLEISPGRWTDTFLYPISYKHSLPPWDYARAVRTKVNTLAKYRRGASLWIQVASPGRWYLDEVKAALYGLPLATAITRSDHRPVLTDFSFIPRTFIKPSPGAPLAAEGWQPLDMPNEEVQALRVLARIKTGYTSEIASLTGFSLWKARRILRDLHKKELIISHENAPEEWDEKKRFYPSWSVKRRGVSLALRSWGVPTGANFSAYKERRNPEDGRHRRTSRLWIASLRRAWAGAEIWTGWSEVQIPGLRTAPDALAWGKLDGHETLFWLEVEGGGTSGRVIMQRSAKRFRKAILYAEAHDLHLVFALLAKPWAGRAARLAFVGVPEKVAVVIADWKGFGTLPIPQWGRVVFGRRIRLK
jgi:hypothetical protein